MKKNKPQNQRGFVILYAVLVASVVSISGILLANIIVKQLILSSIGRETQAAYYAANAGAECADYGYRNNYFGRIVTTEAGRTVNPPSSPDAYLDLPCVDLESGDTSFNSGTYTLRVVPEEDSDACADVMVRVDMEGLHVTSRGYNMCEVDHPRAVAREIYRFDSGN